MKQFIVKLAIFLAIFWLADICIGAGLEQLSQMSKGGTTYAERYTADIATEEILIMGSSRANHHYIPSLIKDSLGMSCYNAGIDGNGIVLMYGKYKMLTKRYTPKVIIYDISIFDIKNDDKTKYLGRMKPYYDYEGIKEIFNDVEWKETVKMEASKLYRYNSTVTSLITNSTISKEEGENGYLPLNKTMDYIPEPFEYETYETDSLKLRYIEELITKCKGKTKLFFAISPNYFTRDTSNFGPIFDICAKHGIPVLNHCNDSNFIEKIDLYQDRTHLNHKGAQEYTKVIINEIKELI